MRRQTVFIGMTPTLRLRIETTIENLLSLLDEIDGDENLEPDHAGFDRRAMDDRESLITATTSNHSAHETIEPAA
ncbi:hypothetical protein [Mesorhizobium sangaii]|uniref:Uncharacterized protein n=1 Tax=Mesorhizobium sangaii TaxID=505389 RepID=A0A841PKY0_9HYPH|nr:hypothetical protein [Mesorhizobium sangaii]MBB6410832.1 hypothetical protein [Mesorhizobium sangaii]